MNKEEQEALELWFDAQPGSHVEYDQMKEFLAEYVNISPAHAEVEMARLVDEDKLKYVEGRGSSIIVFMKPLPDLTEDMVRSIHDGPKHTTYPTDQIIKKLHYRTGRSKEQIEQFLRELEAAGKARVNEEFEWKHESS